MAESRPPARAGKVTIYDVAARAGVSITTVSHTLNRPHKVSPATRRRVLDSIDELEFVPKETAVSRARKALGRIGVIAPFTSYPSYGQRLLGVLEGSAAAAVDIVVFDHGSVAEAESPLLSSLPMTGRLDGLLIMGIPLDDGMADRLRRRKLATVLVDSDHASFDTVNVDDDLGGYLLARHLIDRGHRRFAFVSEAQASVDYVSAGHKRLIGIMRALKEAGIGRDAINWVVTDNDVGGGRNAAGELLALSPRPTAVLAVHDDLAAGVLAGLRDAEVPVPSEMAVVGYDGGQLAEALDLTTVVQPFAETGRLGVALLLAAVAGRAATVQHVLLSPELVAGRTT